MAEKTPRFALRKMTTLKAFQLKTSGKLKILIPTCKCGTKMEHDHGARTRTKTNQIVRPFRCPRCGFRKSIVTEIISEPDTIIIPDFEHAITDLFEKVYLEFEKKFQQKLAKIGDNHIRPELSYSISEQLQMPNFLKTNLGYPQFGLDLDDLLDEVLYKVLDRDDIYALLRTFFYAAIGQTDTEIRESMKKIGTRAEEKVKLFNSKGDIVIMEYPKADKKVSRNTKTGQKKQPPK